MSLKKLSSENITKKTKPSDRLIKKQVASHFQQKCCSCPHSTVCVRGSNLSLLNDEAYFNSVHGKRIIQNEAMKLGIQMHEEMSSHLKTLDEYGIENFVKNFNSGKTIELRELLCCNLSLGRRGTIDQIRIRKKGNRIGIDILELKTGFRKRNLDQVNLYASIFSNNFAEIIYKTKNRKHETKYKGTSFIPNESFITIRIRLDSKRFGRIIDKFWMINNVLTEYGNRMEPYLQKRLKHLRKFHKMKIYQIPREKENQRFIGRRKWIVKNHPIYKTVNLHENIAN